MKTAAIVAVLQLCVGGIQAASFDCTKATTKIEKMICDDAELSKLDEEMARVYSFAVFSRDKADAIKQSQKDWLKERNRCTELHCIRTSYLGRIAALSSEETSHVIDNSLPAETSVTPVTDQPAREIGQSKYIYQQVKDTGWTVCRDLVKNLNKVGPSKASFNSEIKFDPTMKQFSYPEWQELKIEEHWQEIYYIESYLEHAWRLTFPATDIPPFEEWFKRYQEALGEGFLLRPHHQTGEMMRRKLDPRLRMAQVRFLSDGPLHTVIAYTREKNNVKRWLEREELYEKCPRNSEKKAFVCIDPQNEGLDKRFYAKWGEYFDHPGDHIFLYDPETGRLRDIIVADLAGSNTATNLILHNGRGYIVALYDDLWDIRHIDRMDPAPYTPGSVTIVPFTCQIHIQLEK